MDPEQTQPGEAKDDASHGKHIEECGPSGPGVTAFMEIVEVGNHAAAGGFVMHHSCFAVDREPRIAAGAREAYVNFEFGPFGIAFAGGDPHFFGQPSVHFRRQRGFTFGVVLEGDFAAQIGGQNFFFGARFGFCRNVLRVIERDAGDREAQHCRQADGTADPMPEIKLLGPEGLAFFGR